MTTERIGPARRIFKGAKSWYPKQVLPTNFDQWGTFKNIITCILHNRSYKLITKTPLNFHSMTSWTTVNHLQKYPISFQMSRHPNTKTRRVWVATMIWTSTKSSRRKCCSTQAARCFFKLGFQIPILIWYRAIQANKNTVVSIIWAVMCLMKAAKKLKGPSIYSSMIKLFLRLTLKILTTTSLHLLKWYQQCRTLSSFLQMTTSSLRRMTLLQKCPQTWSP